MERARQGVLAWQEKESWQGEGILRCRLKERCGRREGEPDSQSITREPGNWGVDKKVN